MKLNDLKDLKKNYEEGAKTKADKIRNGTTEQDKNLKIKELRSEVKKLPKKKPFEFTEYLERQQEESEIELGFYLKLVQEGKIVYNHARVHTPGEDIECSTNGFLRMVILL